MNSLRLSTAVAALAALPMMGRGADLSLSVALEAAQESLRTCKSSGYNVTVTILDSDLSTRVVLRGDGARDGTVQIGYRKAYTVLKTRMTSGEFGKTVSPPVVVPGSPPGPVNGDANLITWAGGLPVKSGQSVIGAISVSGAPGGDKDEACAQAGLDKIKDQLK